MTREGDAANTFSLGLHKSPDCWCGDPDHFNRTILKPAELPDGTVVMGEMDGRRVMAAQWRTWWNFGLGDTHEEALENLVQQVRRNA